MFHQHAGRRISRSLFRTFAIRVAVAMSGGIDSAVTALLLKQKGYDCIGVFMRNWDNNDENGYDTCPIERDRLHMREVCTYLNIPAYDVTFITEYWNEVFLPFLDGYKSGIETPNPDTQCNKIIKFHYLKKYVLEKYDVDFLATGHYARLYYPIGTSTTATTTTMTTKTSTSVTNNHYSNKVDMMNNIHESNTRVDTNNLKIELSMPSNYNSPSSSSSSSTSFSSSILTSIPLTTSLMPSSSPYTTNPSHSTLLLYPSQNIEEIYPNRHQIPMLLRGVDPLKDQSYFLSLTKGEDLSNVILPLGTYTKTQVRHLASQHFPPNLSILKKKESMGICFIGKRNFKDFLSDYFDPTPGRFIDIESGDIVGTHMGQETYTKGQKAKISGQEKKYYIAARYNDTTYHSLIQQQQKQQWQKPWKPTVPTFTNATSAATNASPHNDVDSSSYNNGNNDQNDDCSSSSSSSIESIGSSRRMFSRRTGDETEDMSPPQSSSSSSSSNSNSAPHNHINMQSMISYLTKNHPRKGDIFVAKGKDNAFLYDNYILLNRNTLNWTSGCMPEYIQQIFRTQYEVWLSQYISKKQRLSHPSYILNRFSETVNDIVSGASSTTSSIINESSNNSSHINNDNMDNMDNVRLRVQFRHLKPSISCSISFIFTMKHTKQSVTDYTCISQYTRNNFTLNTHSNFDNSYRDNSISVNYKKNPLSDKNDDYIYDKISNTYLPSHLTYDICCTYDTPQFGLCEGQTAGLYDDNQDIVCLGGGIIHQCGLVFS